MATAHLRKVTGSARWYAVLSIPPEVRSVFGRTQFVKGTGTSDRKQAERIAARLVSGWLDEIHAAREKLPSSFQQSLANTIGGIVQTFFRPTQEQIDTAMNGKRPRLSEVDRRMTAAFEAEEFKQKIIAEFVAQMGGPVRLLNNMLTNGGTPVVSAVTQNTTPFLHHLDAWKVATHLKGKTKASAITEIQRFAAMVSQPIEALSGKHVEVWIETLRSEGKSPSTIRVGMSKIRSYWKWMLRHEYVTIDPFQNRTIADGRTAKEKHSTKRQGFAPSDLQRLLDACRDEDLRNLILIAIYSGARRESIVTLRKDQVVTVRGIKCLHFDDKTQAGIRDVPVHSALLPTINQMVAGAKDGYLFSADARGKNQYSQGDRLGKAFSRLKQSMDFPRTLVFHSIRHSVAEQLKDKGCSLTVIRDILGHENPDVTSGYTKSASVEIKQEWIEKVGPSRAIQSTHIPPHH